MPGVYQGEREDDVDPKQFLVLEKEQQDAMNKPYNIKLCWVKDDKEAFIAGEIEPEDGDKVTIKTPKNTIVTVRKDKFYQASDMADLTFLNEANVLENLHGCYVSMRIYVSQLQNTE